MQEQQQQYHAAYFLPGSITVDRTVSTSSWRSGDTSASVGSELAVTKPSLLPAVSDMVNTWRDLARR